MPKLINRSLYSHRGPKKASRRHLASFNFETEIVEEGVRGGAAIRWSGDLGSGTNAPDTVAAAFVMRQGVTRLRLGA